jgi:hypothetical protein
VLRIHEILVRIQIRGSIPLINDPDPDPVFFVSDLQDFKKNNEISYVFMLITGTF